MVSTESSITVMRAADRVDPSVYQHIRQRLVLHGCKWDPQVGDVETIARFPIVLSSSEWHQLSQSAELLVDELMNAETELLGRADLHRQLGLPRGLRQVLKRPLATVAAARVLRFDFHWTDQGWKISEVNSDVPGGFCEASELSRLMAEHFPRTVPAGDPGAAWADAIATTVLPGKPVALLTAPGFMEDRQVLAYLATLLDARGIATLWVQPKDLKWRDGWAAAKCLATPRRSGLLRNGDHDTPPSGRLLNGETQLGGIIRFYQAEWLNARDVPELFVGGRTPVGNPGVAAITESKRFPLVWRSLKTRLPTWTKLLPETRDPREVPWQTDESWLLKTAMCNTGDTVAIRGLLTPSQWKKVKWDVRLRPGNWIAQQRFAALGIDSPAGAIYPCIGVYTVNGKTAGIYGRYCGRPLIDYSAADVAVLIERDELP